jgi:hypothetical protein
LLVPICKTYKFGPGGRGLKVNVRQRCPCWLELLKFAVWHTMSSSTQKLYLHFLNGYEGIHDILKCLQYF